MESKKEIESGEKPVHWNVAEPAQEDDLKAFWKKLRQFYRTGEKPTDENIGKMSSALLKLVDTKSNYPYFISDNQEVTIELGKRAAFFMLDHLLSEHQEENRERFKRRLSELISGLNRLLKIENTESEAKELQKTFDFADEMIAFEKMVKIIPHKSNIELPEARLNRLHETVSTLQSGLAYFDDQVATIVVDKDLRTELDELGLFNKSELIVAENDAFRQTQELFSGQIHSFSELIKAYRIATLEIEDDYQEDIHSDYFEHFTWHRLLQDELNLFHPIVLIVDHQYVFDQLSTFSRLLSSNQPVNIIVLNQEVISTPNYQVSWEDASHQFRQELTALAIAHRNVYTLQTGMDDPNRLYTGLQNCLRTTSPGICHLSVSSEKAFSQTTALMRIKASNAGRYFPSVLYDPNDGVWRERFDLTGNIQHENKWPLFTLNAQTSDESEAMIDVAFTYADYKAMYPEKVQELMLIPSAYYTEHLVPLNDYLELNEQRLYGKIPYIWLLDEHMELFRAVVPNVWVVSCQERLNFWDSLQEWAGVGSSISQSKTNTMEARGNHLLDVQTIGLQEQEQAIAKIKEEAIGQAAERLIAALLEDDDFQIEAVSEYELAADEGSSTSPAKASIEKSDTIEEGEAPAGNNKPWVESENCTSCNECTDQYPNVFIYNDDKQALIKDATKGTYEQLVKAAEKCPAACIHPGAPINPNEKNLEKLITRAEKFN